MSNATQVTAAIRREDTVLRLGGDAYVSAMTWSADDRQLTAIIDGAGWPELRETYYSSRLFSLGGSSPDRATIEEVDSYPDISLWDYIYEGGAPYYGLNALAVDGRIYQFLSTENTYRLDSLLDDEGRLDCREANFTHAKLIYSPDNGRTWCNQNDSTRVRLEARQEHSRNSMAFFLESQDAFSQLSFLQMGRDYADNRDGYVYVYAPNGRREGTMNELVMFRVPKDEVLDGDAYEYFAGVFSGGARWTKDIKMRGIVHTFPTGWVQPEWPLAWLPSVCYNAGLGLYMMANGSGTSASTFDLARPTYLGLWIADNPWGPWRQIHEETAWTPAGDEHALAAAPIIAPKWIAQDGRSFWLVWTDVQRSTTAPAVDGPEDLSRSYDDYVTDRRRWRESYPYFGFNTQRVDLAVAPQRSTVP